MKSLYETERRRPELIVAAAFLWAPAILIVTLALTEDPDIVMAALVVASLPYVGVLLWPFYVSIRETKGRQRAAIVLGTIAFFALAFVLSSLGFPGD